MIRYSDNLWIVMRRITTRVPITRAVVYVTPRPVGPLARNCKPIGRGDTCHRGVFQSLPRSSNVVPRAVVHAD